MKKALAFLFVVLFAFTGCKKPMKFVFAGGFEGGTYDKIGESLKLIKDFDYQLLNTHGSLDNIELLRERKADYSIAQLDVIQNYKIGDAKITDKVKILIPLYTEEVHLLTRKDVKDISGLKGKKISIGDPESGTKLTSRILLGFLGLDEANVKMEETPTETALPDFLSKKIDGLVVVAGIPVKLLTDIPADQAGDLNLLGFEGALYEAINGKNLIYSKSEIPGRTYPWQDASVKTVLVQSGIIARADLPNEEVARFVKTILANEQTLATQHEKWKNLDVKTLKTHLTKYPDLYHPGVKAIANSL